jgi:O-antigen/teichoic acid export membrane protein
VATDDKLGGGDLSGSMRSRQAMSSYIVMAIRLAAVTLNFLVQVAMAHLMDLSSFGSVNTALALLNILVIPAGLNHEMTAIRYVSLNRENLPLLRGMTLVFLRRIALANLATCALIALISVVEAGIGHHEAALAIGMLILIVPTMALVAFGEGWLRGFGSLVRALINSGVVVPVGTIFFLVLDRYLLEGGGKIGIAGAMGARALASLGAVVTVGLFVRTKLRHTFSPRAHPIPSFSRQMLHASYTFTGISLLGVTTTQAGIIATAIFAGSAEAGIFSAAARISQATGIALVAVNFVLAPRIARLYEAGRSNDLQREISSAATWSTVLMIIACVILVPAASFFLGLFGGGFSGASNALRILMIGQLVNAVTGPVAVILQMTGRQNRAIRALAYSLVIEFILFATLIPLLGVNGAAIATAVCNAGQYLVMIVYVRRDMELWSLPNLLAERLPGGRSA